MLQLDKEKQNLLFEIHNLGYESLRYSIFSTHPLMRDVMVGMR